MTRSEAIEFFGSASELARKLGISYEAVRQWPEEKIPLLRQYEIRDLSSGVLKISKYDQATAA